MPGKFCDEYIQAVERHYGFLFSDYGFRLVHREEDSRGPYCGIVLESDQVRLKLAREPGASSMSIGGLNSPLQGSGEAGTEWWSSTEVLAFMRGQPYLGAFRPHAATWDIDQSMQNHAILMREYAPELFRAFGQERPPDWWRAFRSYLKERDRLFDADARAHGWPDTRSPFRRLVDSLLRRTPR